MTNNDSPYNFRKATMDDLRYIADDPNGYFADDYRQAAAAEIEKRAAQAEQQSASDGQEGKQ